MLFHEKSMLRDASTPDHYVPFAIDRTRTVWFTTAAGMKCFPSHTLHVMDSAKFACSNGLITTGYRTMLWAWFLWTVVKRFEFARAPLLSVVRIA